MVSVVVVGFSSSRFSGCNIVVDSVVVCSVVVGSVVVWILW